MSVKGGASLRGALADRGEPQPYRMFGMRVLSDFGLPIPPEPSGPSSEPAGWRFRRVPPDDLLGAGDEPPYAAPRCFGECHGGGVTAYARQTRAGIAIEKPGVGTFLVRDDGAGVGVSPAPGADERALGLALVGEIASVLLHRRGYLCLHASAVVAGRGGVGFLAPAGGGKSTLAAIFVRHGAPLLTDDLLALRTDSTPVTATPSLPVMKLWDATVEQALAIKHELPTVSVSHTKKLLSLGGAYALASGTVPLRALYVLDRADAASDIGIWPLKGSDALAALLVQTSHPALLPKMDAARLLPHYARIGQRVPIRLLRYPTGFGRADEVYARILADLDAV